MKTMNRILAALMSLLLSCSLPVTALADTWYLDQGSITVNATEIGQTVSQGETTKDDNAPVITQTDSSTPTSNTVTINAEENATANVTIQDVNIANSATADSSEDYSGQAGVTIDVAAGATANVTLDGVNINTDGAAVEIEGNGDVVIELDGTNTVQSGEDHAGVEKNTIAATEDDPGSGNGNLTITDENGTDGSLNATGGDYGAGIGGGYTGDTSNITISGGTVTATGGYDGAGIGGGDCGDGSNITISGGTVTATGGNDGAGIGGGDYGDGSNITISGGTVTATGGNDGAGIGGGDYGDGSNITISGGTVEAKGGDGGAGIGGKNFGEMDTGSNITVSGDAQVKAQGGPAFNENGFAFGAGAAIGENGECSEGSAAASGTEVTPNTGSLNEGWIATYAPGTTNLDTAVPQSLTYMGENGVTTSSNAVPIEKQEPTCDQTGHEAGFSVDGKLVAVIIPATGHSFTNYISDGNATCTVDGTKTARCDHAGCDGKDTIADSGSKLEHSMGDFYTVTPATCQTKGLERSDCANCDYHETRELSIVDHSYGDYTSDGNATCTADGTKTRECIWCGLKDTAADPGSKLEHSFNSYISDGNATYEQDGTKTAKCDNCDETDTLPDPGSKLEKREEPVTVSPKPAAAVEYIGVDEAAFWQEVARRIEAANPGDTIQVNAGGICTIPAWVIDAAVEQGVTLFIHWLGGEDFLIDRQPDTGSQTFSVYSFSDLIQMLAK